MERRLAGAQSPKVFDPSIGPPGSEPMSALGLDMLMFLALVFDNKNVEECMTMLTKTLRCICIRLLV
jgi:hypothetical protein